MRVVYWVNVSESSDTSLPGLSWIGVDIGPLMVVFMLSLLYAMLVLSLIVATCECFSAC